MDREQEANREPDPAEDSVGLGAFRWVEKNLDPHEPDTVLDVAPPDSELKREVDSQLAGLRFLDRALVSIGRRPRDEPAAPEPEIEIPEDAQRLGDYRLLSELGRGSMGLVYRAVHPALDREVALKVLPPHVSLMSERVKLFRREAFLAARLTHPNIAQIHDFGHADGNWYYVMELLQGRSLNAILTALQAAGTQRIGEAHLRVLGTRPLQLEPAFLSEERRYVFHVVRLVAELAQALQYAHDHEVLHRDLKPANIVLTEGGLPKITDFGLATRLDLSEKKSTRMGMGTPHYMPPEAFEPEGEPDPRHDVYSLGVMLYELVTLRLPYEGKTLPALMKAVVSGLYEPPSRLNHAVDRELEMYIAKAMDPERDTRYETAGNLAQDLQNYLIQKTSQIVRVPFLTRLTRRIRRNPWKTAAIAAFVVIAVETLLLIWSAVLR